jgi:hypothetical protein
MAFDFADIGPEALEERPLAPAVYEQLLLREAESLVQDPHGYGGGWVRCTDVRLNGAYPATELVVTLEGDGLRGRHGFGLYRPLSLTPPDGRLPSVRDQLFGIHNACAENFGGILHDADSLFLKDCKSACAIVLDIVGPRSGIRGRALRLAGTRVEVEVCQDGTERTLAVDCFHEGRRRNLWAVAEELRGQLENADSRGAA